MLWNDIIKISGAKMAMAPGGFGEVILLPVPGVRSLDPSFWMIHQYKEQTKLATALREDAALQEFIADYGVRFGLRETDRPPMGTARRLRYGKRIVGANAGGEFSGVRDSKQLTQSVHSAQATSGNRRSDRDENVRLYWATQTAQSHHVVEFNHLRDLGVSHETGGEAMDHAQLPCVLLAAEFHQRYFSSILKGAHGWSKEDLRSKLPKTYWSLYHAGGEPFRPLWRLSRIILKAAGLSVT